MSSPLVSICCITYNHEDYIAQTLDGFLMQETDFDFEILVHDDASTDTTADIIRYYELNNPQKIKPIYQIENQHSKGIRSSVLNFQRARGEYIAICEGDDYWTDPRKLSIQIDQMRKHPNCDISFHPVSIIDEGLNNPLKRHRSQKPLYVKLHPLEKVIEAGGGFMPTASIIMTSRMLPSLIDVPEFLHGAAGDYYWQIVSSVRGGALYINRDMAVYRRNSASSISLTISKSEESLFRRYRSQIKFLIGMDDSLHKEYHRSFRKRIGIELKIYCRAVDINRNNKQNLYNEFSNYSSNRDKVVCRLFMSKPFTIILKNIKNLIKRFTRSRYV